jgi:hypothetical protein
MGLKAKIFLWWIIAGLLAIRLSIIIDNPAHLLTPDPNCPICQAYQSQVLLDFDSPVTTPFLVLIYINESYQLDIVSDPIITIDSIRAPPFFHTHIIS